MGIKGILEKKFGVVIEYETVNGEEWCVAYYRVRGRKGKEMCREHDIYELQITLKLYLS